MYSMTLQRAGRTEESPVVGNPVFSARDRVRLSFVSAQSGHLYIFNEGPPETAGRRNVNVLFPSLSSNHGSAALHGGQTVAIPEGRNGFEFDNEKGVEKLWIVWSRDAQPALDVMTRWTSAEYGREIKDAKDVRALDTFLNDHRSPAPARAVDDDGVATFSARADLFVTQNQARTPVSGAVRRMGERT